MSKRITPNYIAAMMAAIILTVFAYSDALGRVTTASLLYDQACAKLKNIPEQKQLDALAFQATRLDPRDAPVLSFLRNNHEAADGLAGLYIVRLKRRAIHEIKTCAAGFAGYA